MPEAWSREEVEAAVADYFSMLASELSGERYNKAEHNRNLQRLLRDRPHGSIERKHQNISAVLRELGYPWIDGYKPLGNYQSLLRDAVVARVEREASLRSKVETIVTSEELPILHLTDVLSIEVAPPTRIQEDRRVYETTRHRPSPATRNYLEMESRNRVLGNAGEGLVMDFEHERLWRAGFRHLANRIERVSQTAGDHLGYDIRSFETDGRDRLIEVKTTRFGALTPFFASRNEVGVSESMADQYHLYRLYNFRKQPKLFVLPGSLVATCELQPVSYSALPR